MPQLPEAPSSTARLGAPHPYFKTHGTKIARQHLFDWLVLVLLAVLVAVLNIIEPFHRFVGEGMMSNLRYPLKENTVPVWAVPIYAVGGPMIVIIGIYIKQRNAYDLHHAILGMLILYTIFVLLSSITLLPPGNQVYCGFVGLLFSVLITGVLTDAIKDGVGRARPNFFWRCFPNGVPRYENITGRVICNGEPGVVKEGYKSFPSGHSSWSFAGLGYLSWYLAGKIKAFDRRGHASKLCIVLLPLTLAAMVAVSRVSDYWHHWQDVVTGGAIGLVVASFCYLQFFPLPHVSLGWCPHAYTEHIQNYESWQLDQSRGPVAMEMTMVGPMLDSIESGHRTQ